MILVSSGSITQDKKMFQVRFFSPAMLAAIVAMCVTVVASNILVQYPVFVFGLEDVLTYGAFTYPFAFLINDLINRRFGAQKARHVVYAGFVAAVVVSWLLATPRLALASACAFLFAQLFDIAVFSPLRRKAWWQAPLAGGIMGSVLDTILFFALAFAPFFGILDQMTGQLDQSMTGSVVWFGVTMPTWLSLALGDFGIKLIMSGLMLLPYGAILVLFRPKIYNAGTISEEAEAIFR